MSAWWTGERSAFAQSVPGNAHVVDERRPPGDVRDAVVARQPCPDRLHSDPSCHEVVVGVPGRHRQVEAFTAHGGADGVHDLHVTGAPADVAGQRLRDRLLVVTSRHSLDVRVRGEQHAGRAEPALHPVVVDERLLHGREPLRRPDALKRRDARAVDGGHRRQARAPRLTVHEHGAGAAATLKAAGLRARDAELLAQHVQERSEQRGRNLVLDSVDVELHPQPPRRDRRGLVTRAWAGWSFDTRPRRAHRPADRRRSGRRPARRSARQT